MNIETKAEAEKAFDRMGDLIAQFRRGNGDLDAIQDEIELIGNALEVYSESLKAS